MKDAVLCSFLKYKVVSNFYFVKGNDVVIILWHLRTQRIHLFFLFMQFSNNLVGKCFSIAHIFTHQILYGNLYSFSFLYFIIFHFIIWLPSVVNLIQNCANSIIIDKFVVFCTSFYLRRSCSVFEFIFFLIRSWNF